jgi:hypothetical protein
MVHVKHQFCVVRAPLSAAGQRCASAATIQLSKQRRTRLGELHEGAALVEPDQPSAVAHSRPALYSAGVPLSCKRNGPLISAIYIRVRPHSVRHVGYASVRRQDRYSARRGSACSAKPRPPVQSFPP